MFVVVYIVSTTHTMIKRASRFSGSQRISGQGGTRTHKEPLRPLASC